MAEEKSLRDNKKVEDSILALQEDMNQERLAVALTAVRRGMKAGAEVIVPVQAAALAAPQVDVMSLEDGNWLYVYTSFEEQKYSGSQIQSTFQGSLEQVLKMGLESDQVNGVILNPYHASMRLDKHLIQIVMGTNN